MWPGINDVTKHVLSNTLKESNWQNSVFLEKIEDIVELKKSEGCDLLVFGSGQLVQLLLKHDLVDEIWLFIAPLALGTGNKLFAEGAIPAAFALEETRATSSGVIFAHYVRAGDVQVGEM